MSYALYLAQLVACSVPSLYGRDTANYIPAHTSARQRRCKTRPLLARHRRWSCVSFACGSITDAPTHALSDAWSMMCHARRLPRSFFCPMDEEEGDEQNGDVGRGRLQVHVQRGYSGRTRGGCKTTCTSSLPRPRDDSLVHYPYPSPKPRLCPAWTRFRPRPDPLFLSAGPVCHLGFWTGSSTVNNGVALDRHRGKRLD